MRVNPDLPQSPTIKISGRGAARLKAGHIWVYRSDIVSADGVPAGALARVTDERGKFLGMGLYSSASQIALRMISSEPAPDLAKVLRARIKAAIEYREESFATPILTD